MINDISLFIHIVEQRNLAAAGKVLGLPPATVTRRLKKFEESLGCQLIHRSARKFVLTAEGNSYYDAFSDLVKKFEETARDLSSEMHQLSGPLKVFAPTNISIGILQPMWSGFITKYPEIQLNLQINNEMEDVLSSQVDLALRIGPQADSSLYQKRLGSVPTVLVASPKYLKTYGTPKNLTDLAHHKLITTGKLPMWNFTNKVENSDDTFFPQANIILSDIYLASQMARDGHGIALLPMSEIYKELKDEKLERILSPWQGPQRDIFAIWPSGRLLSAKAKALRDYMTDYISHVPLFQGEI